MQIYYNKKMKSFSQNYIDIFLEAYLRNKQAKQYYLLFEVAILSIKNVFYLSAFFIFI